MFVYIQTCIATGPPQYKFYDQFLDKRKPSDKLKKIVGRRNVSLLIEWTLFFCFNLTILHLINKAIRERTHRWNEWLQ